MPMNRVLPFVMFFGVLAAGCSNGPGPHYTDRAPAVFGNVASYDAYVERRTSDLMLMGVTKDRSAAASQAQIDAQRRYGPRTPNDSAGISFGGAKKQPLKMAQIDEALAKAKDPE